ncbi:MAG: protoporphyrinogen oxidase HemJ [Candidatus Aquirickettsiella sp.]
MAWIKAFHIIGMVAWFAGLFYLPRLFVYHANAKDTISIERFKLMEHRLYYYIMAPAALLTLFFGFTLFSLAADYYAIATWMHLKLGLVAILILFHLYCGKCLHDFKQDDNQHSSLFYRWLNELPTLLLITIVIIAEVRPF